MATSLGDAALDELVAVLQAATSADRDLRTKAEARLGELSRTPGYATKLCSVFSFPPLTGGERQISAHLVCLIQASTPLYPSRPPCMPIM
mmetsp:Transcript_42121/g.108468  ORF Transcript_42121/g.108468 Transcript_42121/m.108468 type:complete len:90 (+) Transcript_42121:602-871(+)